MGDGGDLLPGGLSARSKRERRAVKQLGSCKEMRGKMYADWLAIVCRDFGKAAIPPLPAGPGSQADIHSVNPTLYVGALLTPTLRIPRTPLTLLRSTWVWSANWLIVRKESVSPALAAATCCKVAVNSCWR